MTARKKVSPFLLFHYLVIQHRQLPAWNRRFALQMDSNSGNSFDFDFVPPFLLFLHFEYPFLPPSTKAEIFLMAQN